MQQLKKNAVINTEIKIIIMETNKMKKHVTLAGSLQIGFSVLGLMAAVAIFAALTFAKGMTEGDEVPQVVLGFLSISLPILLGSLSILGLVGGIGVLVYKSWARYLVIVLATMGCINVPFGTAKGVYTIWVLIQDETVQLFSKV
jgi:hypothetical protein